MVRPWSQTNNGVGYQYVHIVLSPPEDLGTNILFFDLVYIAVLNLRSVGN